MRLHYSSKAARQVAGAPPTDCGTHPNTTYRKVPAHLKDRLAEDYDYACEECLKELERQVAEERAAERRARAEAEAELRAARKASEEAADREQTKLASLYEQAVGWEEDHARRVEQAADGVARTQEQAAAARREVAKREEALLAARQALAKAKADLQRAEEAVGEARSFEGQVQEEKPFAKATIETALHAYDEAWAGVPPRRRRKKMDRALRKRVVKLLERTS